jgi:hypothetical protein
VIAGSFFFKTGVEEILKLQPKGSKAEPYEVKQVRHVVLKYGDESAASVRPTDR